MTTLTFDTSPARPAMRRGARRRVPVPARAPAASSPHIVLTAPAVLAPPRKRLLPMLLVAGIGALHAVLIVSLSGGKQLPGAPVPVPVTITFAAPIPKELPPPPPPPKAQVPTPRPKAVRPASAPVPAPPAAAVAASDTPLVAPTVDTVPAAPMASAPAAAPPPPPPVEEKLTEARGYAGYLSNPAPDYPVAAQKRGLEGRVVLKVRVLASGRPDSVLVATSSGHQILDDAAIKAVLQWVFAPAKRGQTAVDGAVLVPLSFKL